MEKTEPNTKDKPYPDCPFLLLDVRDRDSYQRCHVVGGKRERLFSVSLPRTEPGPEPGRLDPHPEVSIVLARGVPGTCELAPPHALREAGEILRGIRGPGLNVRMLPVLHCVLFSSLSQKHLGLSLVSLKICLTLRC